MPRKARPIAALTTEDAARYLSIAPGTLEKKRLYGDDGPPFATLFDSAVRYRITDLDAWLAARVDRSVHERKKRRAAPKG